MNFLKLKAGLLSLLTVFTISVFLSSCEQDYVNTNDPIETITNVAAKTEAVYILPHGYDDLSQKQINEYVESLDESTTELLVESRKVAHYFKYLDKFELLYNNAKDGDIFDNNTLDKYLSKEETEGYSQFEIPAETDNQYNKKGCSCSSWSTVSTWVNTGTCIGLPPWCTCHRKALQERSCGGAWYCFFYKERRVIDTGSWGSSSGCH